MIYICVPHRYHDISDTFLLNLSIIYLCVSNLLLNIYIYIYILCPQRAIKTVVEIRRTLLGVDTFSDFFSGKLL